MLSCLFLVSLETFTGLGFELKRQKHTHTHTQRNFLSTYFIPYHTIHPSYRFIFFLLIFFRCVLLCVSLVTTCLVQFLIIVDSFYTIFDWDIRMRIVSILFDLIFAYFLTCFQNKVLSCLIRRQSFVFSYLPANQPASHPSIQLTQIKLTIWLRAKKLPRSESSSSSAIPYSHHLFHGIFNCVWLCVCVLQKF